MLRKDAVELLAKPDFFHNDLADLYYEPGFHGL
jgi:hypothetical protein